MTPLALKLQGHPKVENGLLCTYISIEQIKKLLSKEIKFAITDEIWKDLLDEWLAKQGPEGKGFSRCTDGAQSPNAGLFSSPINIYKVSGCSSLKVGISPK